jgi:glycosyltransferase involved in cell wall biosynthesis
MPTPTETPLISFAVPCYNVAEYLERSIGSILAGVGDLARIEVILVDDGSAKDDTAQRIDAWQARHPDVIVAIHQPNGGHGEAINTALSAARGLYFKVLDADDWLDAEALGEVMEHLTALVAADTLPDLLLTNYVYEKVDQASAKPIRFGRVLPAGRVFDWSEVGRFAPQQNLLMHTATYRTALLRDVGLRLPAHTFYVDNIYVYLPLPAVRSIYYLDVDLYRYYIGRAGQSVDERTMVSRIDQQLRVTRIMIDAFALQEVEPRRLRDYMSQYLLMMLSICAVFLRLSDRPDREEQRKAIWQYLAASDPATYNRLRGSALGLATNLPGGWGRAIALGGYRLTQRLYKFN